MTPEETARYLAVEATTALARLRTAWPWLAEARVPGPEAPAGTVPDDRPHIAAARAHQADLDWWARQETLRTRTVPQLPRAAPARLDAVHARNAIADDLRRLAERLHHATTGRDIAWRVSDPASRRPPHRCPVCDARHMCGCDHADAVYVGADMLCRILIPLIRDPDRAADALRVVERCDRLARRASRAAEHRTHVAGPCPACDNRDLWAETSSPERVEWTVRCEAPLCTCRGPGCPCGRPQRWRGRRHVWPAAEWGDLSYRTGAVLPDEVIG